MYEEQIACERKDGEKKNVRIDQCESSYDRQKNIQIHHRSLTDLETKTFRNGRRPFSSITNVPTKLAKIGR